jgi:uncharacterized repeat protein (TIGR02543 family)
MPIYYYNANPYTRYYNNPVYYYIVISYYKNNGGTLIESYQHAYPRTDKIYEALDPNTDIWSYHYTETGPYSNFNLRTVPNETPIGYTDYWNSQSNGSGTTYNSGSTYNAGGSTTSFNLFVIRIINSYNLTFDYQGKGTNSTTSKNYNTLLYFPSVTEPAGYTFLGWSKFATSGTYNVANMFFYMPASNITYYAGWQGIQYSVAYNSNGGTAVSSPVNILNGQSLTFPSTTKSGYKLIGWNDGTNTITTSTIIYEYAKGGITFTAIWQALYTLTFNSNGKGQGKVISNIDGASPQLAPTLNAVGYTFNGWYTDQATLNLAVNGGTNYTMPSSNTTLYAKWTDNTQIRLSDLLNTYGNINTGNSITSISEYQNILGITASTRTSFNTNLKGKGPAPP